MGARGVLGGAISKIAGNRNLELRLRKTAISAYTQHGPSSAAFGVLIHTIRAIERLRALLFGGAVGKISTPV